MRIDGQYGDCFRVFSFLLLAGLSGCGGGGGDDDGPATPITTTNYQVNFSPEQVVSGASATNGVTATANLRTDAGDDISASGSVTVSGATATAVTINTGFAGETGPVVVSLTAASGGTWNLPAGTLLDQDDLNLLEDTGFHVVVETPLGKLRGQILPPEWELISVDLTAAAAVPFSNAAGSAKAGVTYHPSRGALRIRITTAGVTGAMGASVRGAIAGAFGDVDITLEQSLSNTDVWGTDDINDPNRGTRLSLSGLDEIERGEFCLTVDTATHPDGAIRAQILTEGVATYETPLTDAEVVTSGAPVVSDGEATAIVTYKASTRDFGIALNTDRLNATSVFVQTAPAGSVGAVIITLMPDSRVPGNWYSNPGALTTELAEALEDQEFYVSVYTPPFPDGELRGQVTLQDPVATTRYEAVVDKSTTMSADISYSGGSMSLVTADNVQVTMNVPQYAVADFTPFSMSEITSVNGFPDGVKVLGAVQLGPADTPFAHAVNIDFNFIGMRTPGTVLAGFKTDNDGTNLRLVPLRDQRGIAGRVATAREGDDVQLATFSFSNVGVLEIEPDRAPQFSFELIEQTPDIDTELVAELFELALNANLDFDDIEHASDEKFRRIVRERRVELTEWMDEFTSKDALNADDLEEFGEILIATNITNSFDLGELADGEDPLTSIAELEASQQRLLDTVEIYGAGLHLACFYSTDDQSAALIVASISLLQFLTELIDEDQGVTFETLAEEVNRLSDCFYQPVLDAFFESFDQPTDQILGTATNVVQTLTDNIADQQTIEALPDRTAALQFVEPQLVSTEPLVVEFREITDRSIDVIYTDVARVTFVAAENNMRMGQIELMDEISFPVESSQEARDAGERPFVTVTISDIGSGPISLTPTSIGIDYTFDNRERSNGLVENVSRTLTGAVSVSKNFTPRSFRDEIDLE